MDPAVRLLGVLSKMYSETWGGLGQVIYNNVQLGFYPGLTTLILLIYALVIASDWTGERVRLNLA